MSEYTNEAAKDGCEWCNASREGSYSMAAFQNPQNPKQEVTLAVYGGKIRLEIQLDADNQTARLEASINYCPMCGRRFTEEEIDD